MFAPRTSLEKRRRPSLLQLGGRSLSIELLPNQAIHRSTFLGAGAGMHSPSMEMELPLPPTGSEAFEPCSACAVLMPSVGSGSGCGSGSGIGVRIGGAHQAFERSGSMPAYKRHAVILPTRHAGPMCQMPLMETPMGRVGEGALTEWELSLIHI